MDSHQPVLLQESLSALGVKPDGVYLDLTVGRAGHASEILRKLTTGKLFAFDKDEQAITESKARLGQIGSNFTLVHSDFKNFKSELHKLGVFEVDGILADLGVSSPQIDEAERGFSYSQDAKLDMRMDKTQVLTAHIIVNEWSAERLATIFRDYADVKLPQRVAKGIVSERPINTTLELVDVIKRSLPAAVLRQKNPAKAVFQALRIAVNEELEALQKMLDDAPGLLKAGGVLAVITFHSIEDRIVKRAFGNLIRDTTGKLPVMVDKKWRALSVEPSEEEVLFNKRSRSAKLRVLIKLKD